MSVAKTMAGASLQLYRVHNTSFYCKPLVLGNIPEGHREKGLLGGERRAGLKTFFTAGSHEQVDERTNTRYITLMQHPGGCSHFNGTLTGTSGRNTTRM